MFNCVQGICGLIGGCLADIISNWRLLFSRHVNENDTGQLYRHIKILIWLLLDILLNIFIGLTPVVDNFTHMGGMLFGFCCGLSTMKRLSKEFFGEEIDCRQKLRAFLLRSFGIFFSCICIVATFSSLLSLKNGEIIICNTCRYISCVPFPFWAEQKWW